MQETKQGLVLRLGEFLRELDQSLSALPAEKFRPTASLDDEPALEHIVNCYIRTKESDIELVPNVYHVSHVHPAAPDDHLIFATLGNIADSPKRAIALAHILNNLGNLREAVDRLATAFEFSRHQFDLIRGGNVDAKETAQKAIAELDAISTQPARGNAK